MRQKRFCVWTVLFISFMVIFSGIFLFFQSDAARFRREFRQIELLFPQFEKAKQSEVPPDVWEEAWGWTQTAIVNVCSPNHVGLNELSDFRKQLEERSRQPIRVETLCWIWSELKRIEPSGQHGDNYVKRYKLMFLQSLARGGHKCSGEQ